MTERDRRFYADACAATIAADVVGTGFSKGWGAGGADGPTLGATAEARLAYFNIGCVDAERGNWAHVVQGTNVLRDALRGAASMMRRYTVRFPSGLDAAIFAEVWSEVFDETPTIEGALAHVAVALSGPSRQEIDAMVAARGGVVVAWPGRAN